VDRHAPLFLFLDFVQNVSRIGAKCVLGLVGYKSLFSIVFLYAGALESTRIENGEIALTFNNVDTGGTIKKFVHCDNFQNAQGKASNGSRMRFVDAAEAGTAPEQIVAAVDQALVRGMATESTLLRLHI
jgi:hypothetical protein